MSYSSDIKDRIMNKDLYTPEEFLAVLYRVSPDHLYRTTYTALARQILFMLKKQKISVELESRKAFKGQHLHLIRLPEKSWDTVVTPEKEFLLSFLFMGTMSHPSKDYRLEFVTRHEQVVRRWVNLLKNWDWDYSQTFRKDSYILYTKNSEWIGEALYLLEGMNQSIKLENSKIIRSLKRDITQMINFEVANQQRVLKASDDQVEKIQWLQKEMGLSSLSEDLAEIASLRLEYPEASLAELGEKTHPPITKSAVSYRFKKLEKLFEKVRS